MKIIVFLSAILSSLGTLAIEKIRVGSSPVLSTAGLYLAYDHGYFKDYGLDVEIIDFPASGGGMTMLLANNKMEVGAGNLTSGLFNAIAKGEKIKIVADKGHVAKDRGYIGLIVRTDHIRSGRYKSLKDLKGFKMGLTSLDGVSQQIVAEKFLEKGGLKESDVQWVKLSYVEMNFALKNKQLDATISLEPMLTEALEEKFATLIGRSTDVHPLQQSAAMFFSTGFAEKRQEEAVKFLAAYIKGIRLYNKSISDPSVQKTVIASLKKYMKIKEEHWSAMAPVGLDENGKINKEALAEDLAWYLKRGFLKQSVSIDEVVDNTYVEKAVARLDQNGKTKK